MTKPIYQVANPTTNASIVTPWSDEATSAAKYGYSTKLGTPFKASTTKQTGLTAVHRLFKASTGDFQETLAGSTAFSTAIANGYADQGARFYALAAAQTGTQPVYSYTKSGKHRLATAATAASLTGWTRGAIAFHVPSAGTTVPVPPVTVPPAGASESFTIAVIPDTQQETWSDTDTRLADRSTWLVNNATKLNLKYVTHIGDVVDWGNAAPEQYTRAQKGLAPLKGKIPYSLTIGNHDTAAVCQGGSACPGVNTNLAVRDTKAFNTAFPLNTFPTIKGAYEPGKVDNTYSTFTAAGQKWMVLNLELWPRQGAIDWAKKIVAANPDHNIIISTHAYLNGDATISTSNGGYGATSPKHLYDTLIKVYPNIKIVVSGHTGTAATRTDTGTNGNKIISLMQTYHSRTTNPVRLITINVANGTLKNWVYAPKTNETLAPETTTTGLNFTR
ncbi:hypothetical protein BW730_00765 [Tessaracoccus aquimaris]|uniref:Uncharacterized protein n=2 Tax=Tessaracoccus aquimaris TaxID=1332264 RepID=A0A1Q2CSM1_9ACTN|nr:hypothetical protein BW730_00765 [Tessaracoccus aquimaris]